jgi:hypothetical protein
MEFFTEHQGSTVHSLGATALNQPSWFRLRVETFGHIQNLPTYFLIVVIILVKSISKRGDRPVDWVRLDGLTGGNLRDLLRASNWSTSSALHEIHLPFHFITHKLDYSVRPLAPQSYSPDL